VATDPRDDYTVFAGSEHMFHGLGEPYRLIREMTEASLRRQVVDAAIESIACHGAPKWLTMGRKVGDGEQVIVTYFGFCVQARLVVTSNAGQDREDLESTLTFLLGRMDEPGQQISSMYLDLHDDARARFDDKVFQLRFVAFRQGQPA